MYGYVRICTDMYGYVGFSYTLIRAGKTYIVPGMRMCDWLALHDLKLCTEPDKENSIIIITKNSGAKPHLISKINSQK